MQTKSVYKVPNGKLIKIFLEYNSENQVIDSIQIFGDFFAYPEESICQLEKSLQGKPLEKQQLNDLISDFVRKNQVEFIGISPESITEAVLRCPI